MNYGKTNIVLCRDFEDLGQRAGADVAAVMRELLGRQDEIRMVFAAAESQITFLDSLAPQPDLDWSRVVCFNMDDFWEPKLSSTFTCGRQTKTQLYDKVKPKAFHLIDANAADPQIEAERFESILKQNLPLDILCQGIGTSGHLALNEPGITRFDDPAWVKVVDIAEQSKRQLREDPNFKELGYIPEKGITMTISALRTARHVFTMVPLALKRDVLTRVLSTPEPDENLPATILSLLAGNLYVDKDSCPLELLRE